MKSRILLPLTLLMLTVFSLTAQQKFTYDYVVRDSGALKMDVYVPAQQNEHHACLIFVFGGGFLSGSRNDTIQVNPVVRWAMDNGYVLFVPDYRLGLKGMNNYSVISGVKKFDNAIDWAAEDLLSSVDYILKNMLKTPQFTIDPQYIITMGSSAGAITVLQADYKLGNQTGGAKALPEEFRFAAVLSFSGAIFSHNGSIKYKVHAPAPTLLYHGTDDRLVIYNKIQLANLGLFGSNHIAKRFKKYDYPYSIRRYKGAAHEIAGGYIVEFRNIEIFLDEYVYKHRKLQQDITIKDPDIPTMPWSRYRIRDLKQ
ncbi:MAG: alpha/beta hydrolase [Bacteroidales bacterium]|nr:alpha/beta hydrolase [Bacteroidales bacterium]